MANKISSATKVVIPCRISFANIFEAKSINGGEAKYSVSCLIRDLLDAVQDYAGEELRREIESTSKPMCRISMITKKSTTAWNRRIRLGRLITDTL